MARRLKYSSQTYGFGGQIIEGYFTKRGRPVELTIIDESMAMVVALIYRKFIAGTPIARIVKQLNDDTSFPRPPKSTKNRFSRDFVINALKNERYLGVFVYNGEADVSIIAPDEMRELAKSHDSVFSFPELQIISDEEFVLARMKLQKNADRLHLREPKSKRPASDKRPMLLNGFLFCPECDNQLVATGAHGNNYGCKTCKFQSIENQHLYSQMPRQLSTEMFIEALCSRVFTNEEIVEHAIFAFVNAVKQLQQPDPDELKKLEQQRKNVRDSLDTLLEKFDGEHVNLVEDQLDVIKGKLARLDSKIATQRSMNSKAISVPTEEEARQLLLDFAKVLSHFSLASNGEELDQARELIRILTGGRIEVYQCGEKAAQKGWLQMRFNVYPDALLLESNSIESDVRQQNCIPLVIDIVKEKETDPRIAMARQLYDEGMFEKDIAKQIGVSRGLMCQWINKSFEAEGLEKPNGCQRRKRIESERGLHHYQQISDRVFELAESGMKLQDIAELLTTNRDVITKSWNYAREKRKLPPLDGRTRRKSLPRKPR